MAEDDDLSEPFDLSDPLLVRVRELALALPGAAEKLVVGQPAFYTRKVFAYFGMSQKIDGEWEHRPPTLSVLLQEDERRSLLDRPDVTAPGYVGPSGFLSFRLDGDPDWVEVAELLEESFRQTAGVRLVRQLDERG